MSEIAISLNNVSKCFKRYAHPVDRLQELLLPGKSKADEFWALRDINLEIPKGQTVGIVGKNGSGKSTLLQIIAGTLTLTTGNVQVNGRVSALLELGSGFNLEFTGRQNVFFNAKILGLSKKETEEKFDEIARFADIGDFIDQPVKTYSSGMFVRLAFAVATSIDPDILIVDEALSVGDEAFQRKCFARIQAIQEKGGTILFVSHSASSIVELCNTAVLIDKGELLLRANPKLIVSSYQKLLYAPPEKQSSLRDEIRNLNNQNILNINLQNNNPIERKNKYSQTKEKNIYDPNMRPQSTVSYIVRGAEIKQAHITTLSGERANILQRRKGYIYTYSVCFHQTAYKVRCGMLIKTTSGLELGGATSHTFDNAIACVEKGSVLQVQFKFHCCLQPGVYFLNAGVLGILDTEEIYLHRCIDAAMFRVQPEENLLETNFVDFNTETYVSLAQPNSDLEQVV
ncbi:ABC transporter ATP-binding protein [Coleofasciculus sp. FACHB-SPT36]|uniref:ABC transporter ATP-binding protein n=1 Tax=Cyanophyceae TaxID=3028117 RepID=UPI00168AE68B|nr:ABC transporter ATP-binding protein [Coleofasciculus sp. FACHB-SPT36]MBD2537880.1 ABC transporter ATP-binding protein [Coleofasciculus sp. FACHB-SPT36]